MKDLLTTHELQIGYQNQGNCEKVLHSQINVALKQGEFVCLLGPNGAGKSTLLKTISGFVKPIAGSVLIGDKPIVQIHKHQLAKLISIVFTEKIAVPDMTIRELVSLGRSPYTGFFGKLSSTDIRKTTEAMQDTGIAHLQNRPVLKLSDGELQKAMIAKALVQDTPIILLDEPTAFLDLPSRIEIMNLLRELAVTKNKAILLSTHDLDLALKMADKIWLLAADKNIETGAPEDLILNDEFKRFFEKDGILFDNESGSFRVDRQNVKTIRLIGKGLEYKWVQQALLRSGYETTQHLGDYMQIEIHSNGHREYHLKHPSGKTYELRTIEDLLYRVNHPEKK
jgi:iron complex transport system ATP-binding protein